MGDRQQVVLRPYLARLDDVRRSERRPNQKERDVASAAPNERAEPGLTSRGDSDG